MNASTRDLIIAVAACALIIFFFASIELIELFFDFTRKYEEWNLDEVIAAVPALALVTAWFAGRRWREVRRLNGELEETVAQLEEAIAQRRAMEEQLGEAYKMAAMGALTGGLAHEFNNVLQPIVTLAQLTLDRDDLPEEQRTRIRHILKAAEHGCEVVKGTLAFPAGGTEETHDLFPAEDVPAFVEQARGNLREVEIDTRIAADPVAVRVNRTEFNQVLTNLVKNAAEAMDPQGQDRDRRRLPHPRYRRRARQGPGRRQVRPRYRGGQRPGHGPRGEGPDLRSLLHHQGGGRRHGTGSCHRLQPGPGMGRKDLRVLLPRERGGRSKSSSPGWKRGLSDGGHSARRRGPGGALRVGDAVAGGGPTRFSRRTAAPRSWRPPRAKGRTSS